MFCPIVEVVLAQGIVFIGRSQCIITKMTSHLTTDVEVLKIKLMKKAAKKKNDK